MGTHSDWRLVCGLFVFTGFVESLAFGHFAAFTPLYLHSMGVPASQVPGWTGFLGIIGFIVGLPLLPFWGAFAERYGRKPVIVRSALVEAVIFLLASLAHHPAQFAVARFLSGFVLGNTGVMLALQSELSPPSRQALALSLVNSGPPIAIAIGPLFGGIIASRFGLHALFGVDSALTALSALSLTLLLRESPRPRSTAGTGHLAREALFDVYRIAPVRRLFTVYLLFAMGVTAVLPFMPLWLHRAWLLGHRGPFAAPLPAVIGGVLTVGGAAMALGTPFFGWLGDRIGVRRALLFALWGNGIGMLAQAAVPLLWPITLARSLQGLFQGGVMANLMTMVAQSAPADRRASVLNLAFLPQQFAWFLGPAIGTALTLSIGLQGMLLAMSAVAFLGAPLAQVYLHAAPRGEAGANVSA